MGPVTDFTVEDKYTYMNGFGNYHSSEALPGANSLVNNSPQAPAYGLRTERISGTSFTAPRDENLQTWMYRVVSSLDHGDFSPLEAAPPKPTRLTPNAYMWPKFPVAGAADWTKQTLLAQNGDPSSKTGLAVWIFAVTQDMPERTAFCSLDGETLIVPHHGALDIQTELGRLLVRQNEIAVIPRGVRYRVTLPAGPTRGYVCELYQGHFRLPNLGAIGSTGLANVRDFEVPTAAFDGTVVDNVAQATHTGDWTILARLSTQLWACQQNHTPFDVAAWHGTSYPYKYDLARFCSMGNLLFDEHDPSLFVVLTAPTHATPGTSVVDFAIIPPRWMVAEDTYRLPYFHRNTMSEFSGPIITEQNPKHPLNVRAAERFFPYAASLNGSMTAHGATEKEFQKAKREEMVPKKDGADGLIVFLIETEKPLFLSDWAEEAAVKNGKAKM